MITVVSGTSLNSLTSRTDVQADRLLEGAVKQLKRRAQQHFFRFIQESYWSSIQQSVMAFPLFELWCDVSRMPMCLVQLLTIEAKMKKYVTAIVCGLK